MTACALAVIGAATATAKPKTEPQGAPGPATIVFRCQTPTGEIQFADTPCRDQPSQKLRIEHYTVFSTPIDPRSAARLADISTRLERERRARLSKKRNDRDKRIKAKQQTTAKCDAIQAGLNRLRVRKKTGYALRDAQALQAQEQTLQQQQQTYCD